MKLIPAWPTIYTLLVVTGLIGTFYFVLNGLLEADTNYNAHTYWHSLVIGGVCAGLMLWGAVLDYQRRKC